MKLFVRKPPWYTGGLAFQCVQCGQCCAGPAEGYVWVTDAEVAAIARHLGAPEADVRGRYVRQVGRRFSLREQPGSNDCVFLTADASGERRCRVYPVRPLQCRTWPFWRSNLRSGDAWARAGIRCPGINRGETVAFDEIERKRSATQE